MVNNLKIKNFELQKGDLPITNPILDPMEYEPHISCGWLSRSDLDEAYKFIKAKIDN
jgi:hypothetical protein